MTFPFVAAPAVLVRVPYSEYHSSQYPSGMFAQSKVLVTAGLPSLSVLVNVTEGMSEYTTDTASSGRPAFIDDLALAQVRCLSTPPIGAARPFLETLPEVSTILRSHRDRHDGVAVVGRGAKPSARVAGAGVDHGCASDGGHKEEHSTGRSQRGRRGGGGSAKIDAGKLECRHCVEMVEFGG